MENINKNEIVRVLNLLKVGEQVHFRAIYPSDEKCEKYGIQKASEKHDLWDDKRDRCRKFKETKEIVKFIENGYNIYFVVNNGGNTKKEIKSCPAIFCEFDDLLKEEQLKKVKDLMPEPSLIVDSGNKSLHFFWVFNEAITPSEWENLQVKLINYLGSDPTIKDLPRVMRLAGCKAQETGNLSAIVELNEIKYNLSDFANFFPENEQKKNVKNDAGAITNNARKENSYNNKNNTNYDYLSSFSLPLDIEIDLLAAVAPSTENYVLTGVGEGQRNDIGFKNVACYLVGTAKYLDSIGQKYSYDPLFYLELYAGKCNPPLAQNEVESIWGSIQKNSDKHLCLDEEQIKARIYSRYKSYIKSITRNSKRVEKVIKTVNLDNSNVEKSTNNSDKEYKSIPSLVKDLIRKEWGNELRFNLMGKEVEFPANILTESVEYKYLDFVEKGIQVGKDTTLDVIYSLALENSYHPVKHYFKTIENVKPLNIDNLASYFFGCENPLYNKMLKKYLISAVARIYHDEQCKNGIDKFGRKDKVDTALILKGPQSYRKSGFFETLFGGPEFYTASVNGFDEKNLQKAHFFWCCELAEFERITTDAKAGDIKAEMTTTHDTFRKAYARNYITCRRQFVFAGTVNEQTFLVDPTGNRRFWVIPVDREIDENKVRELRDSIWRAAYLAYFQGDQWWFTREEEAELKEINENYIAEDPWENIINEIVEYRQEISVNEIYQLIDAETFMKIREKLTSRKIGEILRKFGFVNQDRNGRPYRKNNKRIWINLATTATTCHQENNSGKDTETITRREFEGGSATTATTFTNFSENKTQTQEKNVNASKEENDPEVRKNSGNSGSDGKKEVKLRQDKDSKNATTSATEKESTKSSGKKYIYSPKNWDYLKKDTKKANSARIDKLISKCENLDQIITDHIKSKNCTMDHLKSLIKERQEIDSLIIKCLNFPRDEEILEMMKNHPEGIDYVEFSMLYFGDFSSVEILDRLIQLSQNGQIYREDNFFKG